VHSESCLIKLYVISRLMESHFKCSIYLRQYKNRPLFLLFGYTGVSVCEQFGYRDPSVMLYEVIKLGGLLWRALAFAEIIHGLCFNIFKTNISISKATLSLFDWSGLELNEGTRRSLMQRSQQLHHLCTLIKRSLEVVTTSANRFVSDLTLGALQIIRDTCS